MSAPRVRPPANAGDDPIAGSALGHQPEALVAFQKLYGTLWSHGVLDQARELLEVRHGLGHATLQIEPDDHTGCDEINW